MKKQNSRKFAIAVCIAVIVLGVVSLVFYIGGFAPKIVGLFKDEQTTAVEEETTQPVIEFVSSVSGPAEGMSGVILEKGSDFTDINAANEAIKQISDWGFNTVILSKCDYTEAAQLATQAKNNGLFSVYRIESNDIVKSGIADENAAAPIGGIGVDSILISVSQGATKSEAALAAQTLRKVDNTLYIGIFAATERNYTPVCSADVFDYKYIDITIPTSSVAGEFSDFLANYCDGTTKDTVFGMHTELVGNHDSYKTPEEILKQFAATTQTIGSGYAFYRYDILAKNANSLRDDIIDYMKNGILKNYFKELVISSPKKTVFETNQSKVSFVGTGDITKPLTINGQAVKMVEDGYFSTEQQLKPGENIFEFEHNGKKYTYKITYKIKLIDSVSPKGAVNAPGETQLDIVAVANKSAVVTATLNGKTITLVKSPDYGEDFDEGSDYTYFVGSYMLPEAGAADKNIGKITIKATYNGISESREGATVTVNAKVTAPPIVVPEPTTTPSTTPNTTVPGTTVPDSTESTTDEKENTTDGNSTDKPATTTPPATVPSTTPPTTAPTSGTIFKQLTPYQYNGVSGKSKMIVVKKNYAETLPSSTTNDVSVPYFTALPKGTIDYVTGTSSYSGIKYYILASGRRVYQSDVEYLAQGYNMPANELRTVSVSKGSDETKITFTMKWKVPFNVREKPQSFYEQTAGRPYSVKSFTAEYVDIVFYYTPTTDAAPSLNTSVISKTQWIKNSDGSSTLRIFLKKKGGFYGIKYYYNSDGTLTFSIKERPSQSLSGKVIMLDPGHGGNDPGAIGAAIVGGKNVHEATINMALANKIKSKLEAQGATVILTRNAASQTVSLDQRQALCRSTNPDIYIAIHCDASEVSSSHSGTTAYYYKSYSYPLAQYLSKNIVSAYKNNIYASNSSMASKVDRGAKFKGFQIARVEECPSVLIEYGFVTNVTECNALANDKNQNVLAQATVDGIVEYFKNS